MELVRGLLKSCAVAGHEYQVHAAPGERPGESGSDARGPTGDQGPVHVGNDTPQDHPFRSTRVRIAPRA
jgi:hypothetical protein